MRILAVVVFALLVFPVAVHAADEKSPVAAAKQDDSTLDKRLELAKKRNELLTASVREQVDAAIDEIAQHQPEEQREVFRTNMRNVLNYQAIEKASIEAMAEVYTVEELEAQIEYYSKPEAQSSEKKYPEYVKKIYPEITRMLDQAVMRVRTGGTGQ